MHLFLTGATGLIGRRLALDRLRRGDRLTIVSRRPAEASAMFAAGANPNVRVVAGHCGAPGSWQEAVDGCDAVVHLAGASFLKRRWSDDYRRLLEESRIDSTYQVVRAIRDAATPPPVLVSASSVAYYGDTEDLVTIERDDPGDDFLARLVLRWEQTALRAEPHMRRVVLLRFGSVLDERGGVMAALTRLFRLGLGSPWGGDDQWVSWIHWRDVTAIVEHVLQHVEMHGPFNAVSPEPATARRFAQELGAALHRPALLPSPVLRAALGEWGRFAARSSRVEPKQLLEHGYGFLYPRLEDALRAICSEPPPERAPRHRPAPPIAPPETTAPIVAAAGRRTVPPAPVRLLAVDVDGALLRSDGRLAEGVIQAWRSAERHGCVIVPATGRPPRALRGIVRALHVASPLIAYNGAVIWNPVLGQAQHHQPLDAALAAEIVAEARRLAPGLLVAIERLDHWYTDRYDEAIASGGADVAGPDGIGPLAGFLDEPVSRLDFAGLPGGLVPVVQMLRERYWKQRRIALFVAGPRVVHVAHPMVDKSIALQRIAARLGAAREAVMAIGGSEDDRGMLEWAGFGVAVASAPAAAQQIADQVVPAADDLGVARAIQRYVLASVGAGEQ